MRWIDPTIPEKQAQQIFTSMVSLGINGSGEEKGLAAAYMALELRRDKQNAGFYREEAALHTVAVSDEQDQSDRMNPEIITLDEFIDWYDGLKEVIEDRTFSSIVCSAAAGGFASGCISMDVGTRYMAVSRQIGGIVWDINDDNFAEVLELLGVQASGFKREYFLTQAPIPETLSVQIERVVQGQNTVSPKKQGEEGVGDYYYDESRNSIVFYTFVPEPLDEVVITYTLLSAAQDPNYAVDLTEELPAGSTATN